MGTTVGKVPNVKKQAAGEGEGEGGEGGGEVQEVPEVREERVDLHVAVAAPVDVALPRHPPRRRRRRPRRRRGCPSQKVRHVKCNVYDSSMFVFLTVFFIYHGQIVLT